MASIVGWGCHGRQFCQFPGAGIMEVRRGQGISAPLKEPWLIGNPRQKNIQSNESLNADTACVDTCCVFCCERLQRK